MIREKLLSARFSEKIPRPDKSQNLLIHPLAVKETNLNVDINTERNMNFIFSSEAPARK